MLLLRLLLLALVLGLSARATTVIPPQFDELVASSEIVFRGRVTHTETTWTGEGKSRRIVTRVTFAVERTLRGEATEALTLEFLGGSIGGRSFVLAGWPQFSVGDPVVKIFDAKAQLLASNDDWFRTSDEMTQKLEDAARQAGAFPPRARSRDAAILTTLKPGSYTAQVSGLVDTTGIGLVEIYDLGAPSLGRMVNLSSRAVVGTDANILIPGLVLNGTKPRRLLIRAVGPGLSDFGVAGALADPMLAVFRGTERVAANDNCGDGQASAPVAEAGASVGAFPLKVGSRDAALLLELPPGNYTVQVSGAQRSTGPALVEVYDLP